MDADHLWRMESSSSRPVLARLLFPYAQFVHAPRSLTISAACERSDRCLLGDLFAAIPGHHTNGLSYIDEAIRHGARSFLLEAPLEQLPYPQLITPHVRADFSRLCLALAGDPSSDLKTAGITGTNGKTSTTWLLRAIWQAAGHPAGLIGTIHHDTGAPAPHASSLTTPTSAHLAHLLAEMRNNSLTHAALELSSHALDQHRAAGLELDVAAITNITQDHLDYHASFQDYVTSKARLVSYLKPGGTIWLNATSPAYQLTRESLQTQIRPGINIKTFGFSPQADLGVFDVTTTNVNSYFSVTFENQFSEVNLCLPGEHNIENALAAIACAVSTGLTLEEACRGISTLTEIPGRVQSVHCGQGFHVFIDYAHTPDGLSRVLSTFRPRTAGRLIVVFGAGGNRDTAKRPLMGQAAARFADIIVLTSDNPRDENPMRIIHDIQSGIPNSSRATLMIEPDRRHAIAQALHLARPGDTVLIAGKGHETTQTLGKNVVPFSDADTVRTILKSHTSSSTATGCASGATRCTSGATGCASAAGKFSSNSLPQQEATLLFSRHAQDTFLWRKTG